MSRTLPRAVKACVFDAYGTLLDLASATADERPALGDKADVVAETWRTKQLEYTWLLSLMQHYEPFADVTAGALDHSLELVGIEDTALRDRLLAKYQELSPYPEVPDVLRRLRTTGMRTAILSNGSPNMLHGAVKSAGIEDLLEAVLSVEEVRVFKPSPVVYQLACERLGVSAAKIAFMSSNAWDIHGAAHFGFQAVWINRKKAPRERLPGEPVAALDDLNGLPALLGMDGTS